MVSNSDMAIMASVGFLGLGGLAYYAWKEFFTNFAKYRTYRARINQVDHKDGLINPDCIEEEFKNMTDDEKRVGKELMVMGYALSYRSWLLLEQDLLKVSPDLSNYLVGLPKELMVVNKFYPQSIFGIMGEDIHYRDTYGYKFAIQHKGGKSLFIEPFMRTQLIRFPEFYHKKNTRWHQRFWSFIVSLSSHDPFKNYSSSSCILFEGDYITAFGLVNYQVTNDTFTMTKPVAIVKGGIDSLRSYFEEKATEKGSKAYSFLISSLLFTIGSVTCFLVARHYYKQIQERAQEVKDKEIELSDLICKHCHRNKRDVIFSPCHHLQYCNDCCTNRMAQLPEEALEKCTECRRDITNWEKIYVN